MRARIYVADGHSMELVGTVELDEAVLKRPLCPARRAIVAFDEPGAASMDVRAYFLEGLLEKVS